MTKFLNRDEVLNALRDVASVPNVGRNKGRTIYECADGSFGIDYASFPGGVTGDVSRELIAELERDGLIRLKYPDQPNLKMWQLGGFRGMATETRKLESQIAELRAVLRSIIPLHHKWVEEDDLSHEEVQERLHQLIGRF